MYWRKVTTEGERFRNFIVASLFLFTAYEIRGSECRAVGCGGKPADVVFLLDASNSIWRPHFRRQLQFVKDMVDWFTVGRDAMRVALVTYADYPQLQFHLHDHFTKPRLHAAVDAVRQNGGYHTRTGRALAYARRNVLRGAGDEVRPNATKVVVVVTDGLSDSRKDTADEARRTREAGIHVFSVGVGKDVDIEELDAIASSPSKYYTFLVDGYEGLSNILELLAIKTCEVTDPSTSTTTTTTTPTTTMTTTVVTSTTAATTTTTSSATITATTTTTTANAASRTTSDSDSNTVAPGKNRTQANGDDDDNDGDHDDDGSESPTNETMRTPVILSPPTFISNPPDTSPVAELKVPGGEGNSIDALNCSGYFVRRDRANETENKDDEVEKNQVSVFTKTPCYPNGGEPEDKNPENGEIDGEKLDPDRSGINAGRSGRYYYNEHGYWVGAHVVKTRDGHGTDTRALVGREDFERHDVTTPSDDGTVTEGDDRRTGKKTGSPDRNDPRYHVYIGSGPWGTRGYWYRDDERGYLWYRYVGPGQFVLDLDTTNKVREWEEEKERKELSESSTVNTGGEQGTTPAGSGLRTTSPEHHGREEEESTAKSGSDDDTVNPADRKSDGYWGTDERGQIVWYRKTVAGYIEKLYPKDVDQRSTDTIPDGMAKSTPRLKSDEKRPGSMLAEDWRSTSRPTTASYSLTREGSERGNSASEHVEGPEGDVEYDFWRFVRGRRVWLQYVPPNDLDVNDEEKHLHDNPTQAVEIPMDIMTSSVDDAGGRSGTGSGGQWKVIAEKRRAWKSSKTPGAGGGASEELLGDSDLSAEDPSTVRLDDETGRQLWKQLATLTDVKSSSDDSLSDFKTRFQAVKEQLGDAAAAAAAAMTEGNRSDRLHESYWFTDGTGRRFQVVHRYNASSSGGDEFERDGLFLPPQLSPVAKWEHEETQVRGSHDDAIRDPDGAQVRENYGGEYWIRALGPSSNDESGNRKPVDTEALRSRTDLSIDLPMEKKDTKGKTEDRRKNKPALPTETDLSKANTRKSSRVGNRKRHGRKPAEKRCRSKRPIFVVFALNAMNNERLNAVLNVAQTTAARLTEHSSTEIQVRYYPDIVYSSSSSSSDHPGHAPRAADRRKVAADETFTDVARIFSTEAAERRRAGKSRTRRILVLLVDDRLPEEWQTSAAAGSTLKRLPKDVEYLVVGTGKERRVERLERFAERLKSRRTHVIHDAPSSPHSTSNSIADIAEKLVSTICWPVAKTR